MAKYRVLEIYVFSVRLVLQPVFSPSYICSTDAGKMVIERNGTVEYFTQQPESEP